MRAAALIAVLACVATAAHADGSRESRYGPAPERAPTPMDGRAPGYTGATYGGRALGWAGKREIVAPEAQAASQVQPWWARPAPQASQAPQAFQAPQAAQAQQPVRAAYQPQVPAYTPPARSLPQSIYEAPPAAPAPVPVAYAAPVQSAPPFQPGQIGARTYSVGRQFGMTPDAIPPAGPTRMVLIAPPASAPEDDKPREDDDRDWPAKDKKDSDQ
jgi:hypothetical protein